MSRAVVSVDKWYDRHSRSWVVQRKDADDQQVGPAHYSGTKRGADICADDWSSELIKMAP